MFKLTIQALKENVGEHITQPAWSMQDILQRDSMALSATLLAAKVQVDGTDALDWNLATVGNG
jgi:hypothetical protein